MSTEPVVVQKMTHYEKMNELMNEMTAELAIVKSTYDNMKQKHKQMAKMLAKMEAKSKKPSKAKASRKPCGFARPSPVSDDMCAFLNIEKGSEVSRTTVTRALIKYIKEHNLQNAENKKQICPDETLYKLFGEEAKQQTLTYFTMQKYVNHHFKGNQGSP